jgi:GntR family transcriptional regulator
MTEPMYRQIAEDLRARIESGAIARGAKLPTEGELRVSYGAARNTVRDAVKLLASRGLVETRPGRGTFVVRHVEPFVTTLATATPPGAPEGGAEGGSAGSGSTGSGSTGSLADDGDEESFVGVRTQGQLPYASGPQVGVQPAPEEVAARLRLPSGAQVVSRRRQWFMDGSPWSLRTSYYPFEFVARATDLVRADGLPGGAASYLEQRLGLVQVGYQESILARPPTSDEATFLELPDDGRSCVVTVARTCFWQAEHVIAPFRVTIAVLPADRVVLVINSGAVPSAHAAPAVA